MDDRDHDTRPPDPREADEDDELELEPPDPVVLANAQHRAQESLESTRASIDIDEIYRDAERDRGREIAEAWLRGGQFRFQTKHLLIATAALAILLTLAKLGLMIFVVIGVMLSIAGVYLYFQWQEKKHHDEADRRREELYARRRERLGKKPSDVTIGIETAVEPAEPPPPIQSQIDEVWENARAQSEIQFRFSMSQLLGAMTVAALVFGVVHIGGASSAATILGLVALLGLAIHALGFEPPSVVVLGWWLLLVLYVVLSLMSFMWGSVA